MKYKFAEDKKMDINKALNDIIFKYHLDRYYPHYRSMCSAEKILRDIINSIVQNNKKAVFVGNDKTGIEFIRNIAEDYENIKFLFYDSNDLKLAQLESTDWEKYDDVYLISYYGAEYIERWFRKYHIQYDWIYDTFARGGAFLQQEFFAFGKEDLFPMVVPNVKHTRNGWTESIQCEFYYQQSKYENTDNYQMKRMTLEKIVFLSFYMKDFIAVKKYALLLSEFDKQYTHLWEETSDLLDVIKRTLTSRKHKNIVLYWLDALAYGYESDMPYLQSIMKKSIVFEKAFTYIPYTHSTLRSMFLSKKDIEDKTYNIKEITRENSPLICFLEEQGYDIKVYSSYMNDSFPAQYCSTQFYTDWYGPCSMKLWDMIFQMCIADRKCLHIVHAMETHFPYISNGIRDENYNDKRNRYKLAKQELDEQLAFYDAFTQKDEWHIYMSDHGTESEVISRSHVHFNIYRDTLQPRRIGNVFSLLDFDTVLRQMIINDDINETEFVKEYADIGNLDWYSRENIERVFKNKEALTLGQIGYTGVIDKKYIYIHYRTGKEWLQQIENKPLYEPFLFYNCLDDICAPELLPHYRKLVKKYPEDIIEDERFVYSRYLYRLYDNILKHNNMEERVNIINLMLREYPDNSIAIRMGGVVSASLYYILSNENKRKIWGFIDNDKGCLCRGLSMPIIGTNEMENLQELGIKAVILSSYSHLDMLREESKSWNKDIDILDIYNAFEKNGIVCKANFYKIMGTDEDYDVGFPFEEVKQ